MFLRHSHPGAASFVPGHSDLDVTLVLDPVQADDPDVLRALNGEIERLNRLSTFLHPSDVRFVTEPELRRINATESPCELLYTLSDWRRLAGAELDLGPPRFLRPIQVVRHPEFNKWWTNQLQSHLFDPRRGSERLYLRRVYRAALKNQLHLASARGVVDVKAGSYVDDDLPDGACREGSELPFLLGRLRRTRFWETEPEETTRRIAFETLLETQSFYQENDVGADDSNLSPEPTHDPKEDHSEAYRALQVQIEENEALTRHCESVVVYPVAFHRPHGYRIDLVLPASCRFEEFRVVVDAIRDKWGGRNVAAGAFSAWPTLYLGEIYRSPSLFWGFSCPFLAEHLQRFGAILHGVDLRPRAPRVPEEVWDWCRGFVSFHRFNLNRRPEYSSRILNLAQIAAIRIYLVTGKIVTDGDAVSQEYTRLFSREEPHESRLEGTTPTPFFFDDRIERRDRRYDAALAWQSRIYDEVESLLEPDHAVSI